MKPSFIDILDKKTEWVLPLDRDIYMRVKNEYFNSDAQNRGILVEVNVITLLSRMFGDGKWLGTTCKSEFYDAEVDFHRIDIKSTEHPSYELNPSPRQLIFTKFNNEKIYYLLSSIDQWRDDDCSVVLKFHEVAMLSDGKVEVIHEFQDGKKWFYLIHGNQSLF